VQPGLGPAPAEIAQERRPVDCRGSADRIARETVEERFAARQRVVEDVRFAVASGEERAVPGGRHRVIQRARKRTSAVMARSPSAIVPIAPATPPAGTTRSVIMRASLREEG